MRRICATLALTALLFVSGCCCNRFCSRPCSRPACDSCCCTPCCEPSPCGNGCCGVPFRSLIRQPISEKGDWQKKGSGSFCASCHLLSTFNDQQKRA